MDLLLSHRSCEHDLHVLGILRRVSSRPRSVIHRTQQSLSGGGTWHGRHGGGGGFYPLFPPPPPRRGNPPPRTSIRKTSLGQDSFSPGISLGGLRRKTWVLA